ncbi:hypothetical protein [uncultured Dokdonia sp.]|uniref:hypothetical protein n=1 Tax=uncultured Dokdonia sp. TaxID=575653 RepID=UPI0026248A64|nr:hypothetical protein [uncultured Dokdonia sp.]
MNGLKPSGQKKINESVVHFERSWIRVKAEDIGRSIKYYENGMVKEVGQQTDTSYIIIEQWDIKGNKMQEK